MLIKFTRLSESLFFYYKYLSFNNVYTIQDTEFFYFMVSKHSVLK